MNFVAKKWFTRTSGVLTVHFMFIYSEWEYQLFLISVARYILYKHLNGTRWIINVCLMYDLWWISHSMCFTALFLHFSFKRAGSNSLSVFISSYVVMKSQISCFHMKEICSLRAFWSGVMFIWRLLFGSCFEKAKPSVLPTENILVALLILDLCKMKISDLCKILRIILLVL